MRTKERRGANRQSRKPRVGDAEARRALVGIGERATPRPQSSYDPSACRQSHDKRHSLLSQFLSRDLRSRRLVGAMHQHRGGVRGRAQRRRPRRPSYQSRGVVVRRASAPRRPTSAARSRPSSRSSERTLARVRVRVRVLVLVGTSWSIASSRSTSSSPYSSRSSSIERPRARRRSALPQLSRLVRRSAGRERARARRASTTTTRRAAAEAPEHAERVMETDGLYGFTAWLCPRKDDAKISEPDGNRWALRLGDVASINDDGNSAFASSL